MAGRRFKRGVAIGLLVVALGLPAAYWVYRQVTWVEMDLSLLDEYAATESYERLYERIRNREAGEGGFFFVALGDTRSFKGRAQRILRKAAEFEPAFILSNGDIVRHGTVEEYGEYHMPLMRDLDPIPFIPAPGNHEEGPNHNFGPFKRLYGDVRFSFDFAGSRFVGINNGDLDKMGWGDIRYLEDELGKAPEVEHKFVIFHVPPEFLENAVESEGTRGFAWNAKRFHRLMVEHKVDHVFSGHVHGFASEVIDGVRYTITGGGGASLTDNLGEEGRVHHFILVKVSPEGLTNEIIKMNRSDWIQEPIE